MKCHGYDEYIRVQILTGWGKSLREGNFASWLAGGACYPLPGIAPCERIEILQVIFCMVSVWLTLVFDNRG